MKYSIEDSIKMTELYKGGVTVDSLAETFGVPEKSIIAKLSSLGVYEKKAYVNKRGEPPVKKDQYIEQIADLLEVNLELLDSLEKANKSVLILIAKALEK